MLLLLRDLRLEDGLQRDGHPELVAVGGDRVRVHAVERGVEQGPGERLVHALAVDGAGVPELDLELQVEVAGGVARGLDLVQLHDRLVELLRGEVQLGQLEAQVADLVAVELALLEQVHHGLDRVRGGHAIVVEVVDDGVELLQDRRRRDLVDDGGVGHVHSLPGKWTGGFRLAHIITQNVIIINIG